MNKVFLQRYAPKDIGAVLSYREALDGQSQEEGISEVGAILNWTAASGACAAAHAPP